MGSAVRRRCPRGPDPPPDGPMPQPTPAREGAPVGTPACGRVLRGLVGAIGWSRVSPPVRRGRRRGRALSGAPSLYLNSRPWSARGVGPSPDPVLAPGPRGAPAKLVIWLILPVVICLSQRLSHACLSIRFLYN